MKKIPTAEEFILQYELGNTGKVDIEDSREALIEFAKLHVKAALKAASEAAFSDSKYDVENSYPLENIK